MWRRGNQLQKELLLAGSGFGSVEEMFTAHMREDIGRITRGDERYGNLPPKPITARVGLTHIKNFDGSIPRLLRKMEIGERAILTPGNITQDVNLLRIILAIRKALYLASPIRTGHYRSSFRFVVGGGMFKAVPVTDDFSIIGITNIAAYASTLENPTWHRPFNRVWPRVRKQARIEGFDARITYIGQASEETQTSEGPFTYAIPIIQIGYLNTMRGETGRRPARHRKSRRRRG